MRHSKKKPISPEKGPSLFIEEWIHFLLGSINVQVVNDHAFRIHMFFVEMQKCLTEMDLSCSGSFTKIE